MDEVVPGVQPDHVLDAFLARSSCTATRLTSASDSGQQSEIRIPEDSEIADRLPCLDTIVTAEPGPIGSHNRNRFRKPRE